MADLIVRIYEALGRNRRWTLLSFFLLTVLFLCLVCRQTYQEDISDFLPLNNKYHHALKIYQELSGADRIIALFEYRDTTQTDPDRIVKAVERYVDLLQANDKEGMVRDLTAQIDMEKVAQVTQSAYEQIPYYLTADDYTRFDSLLSDENYIATQLAQDKQMLTFPIAGLLSENFQRDPLNLFTPVVEKMQQIRSRAMYEDYDGYIFTPDMKTALVMLRSPFGSSETENNTRLLKFLKHAAEQTTAQYADIDIRLTGGPVIAVGNSNQIKKDSLVSVLLAVFLIVALLFYVFRRFKHLLLIVLSIAWGWLFAMGALALIHDSVSIIVIGISSVILGIAVNYPLHLIAHLQHTPDVKSPEVCCLT